MVSRDQAFSFAPVPPLRSLVHFAVSFLSHPFMQFHYISLKESYSYAVEQRWAWLWQPDTGGIVQFCRISVEV